MDLAVKTEYDREADAAYITFGTIVDGEATQNLVIDDPRLKDGEIVVDLGCNGHVLGVELIGVTTLLARPCTK